MADIADGASVLVSGFGGSGSPVTLLGALMERGATDLTIISNNAGDGEAGLGALIISGRVRRLICSFPRGALSEVVATKVREGALALEVTPQGTLAERIRAAGAGIPAFYTPTSYGTAVGEGKETREFNGRGHVLEHALHADVALVKAHRGDRWGNLTYDKLARNFAPLMATAARQTLVEVDEIVELGTLPPETIVTPGIFVDRLTLTAPVDGAVWRTAA